MSRVVRGLVCAGLLAVSSRAHAEAPTPVTPSPTPVRVYMRTENEPLTFSARAQSSTGAPNLCVAPCDARLLPGDYELKLNGVIVNGPVSLQRPGTLHGEVHSHAGARARAWLGLNVGGILGGVFITVAALGGPSWAYIAGGGSLALGGLTFVVAYRADRATVSFTPGEPLDVRGMPLPQGAGAALTMPGRASFGSQARGLGFRLEF
ncbi:MAG: hypothetical protein ABI548_18645 [Polyangiaceae bacterium]